ncbi:MAG: polysaccharide deacetylase family protein [Akkermansia sp.]
MIHRLLLLLCCLCLPLTAAEPAATPPTPASNSVVSVLGYGHLGSEGQPDAAAFRRHMQYLQRSGAKPIAPQLFLDWLEGKAELPPHAVLVTLDEADAAAYDIALPVLRELGIPFLIFADGSNFRADSPLPIERLREMQAGGGAIGAHSDTRPATYAWQFAALSGEQEVMHIAEMAAPAEQLRRAFGQCVAYSYPRGYCDNDMPAALRRFGYRAAFTCTAGKVLRQADPYRLHRNMVSDDLSLARALNFGSEAQLADILKHITEAPAAPAVGLALPDDDSAEEIDDAGATEAPAPETAAPLPTAGKALTKRHPDGDWVTAHFDAPLVPREQTRVAVLGYHNFSNTKKATEMRMRTAEFCTQMQYIREAGLSPITMEDFLEWLRGERQLPERCVLITIDDGWKSVYTDAYPVLRAYGYPFTLFLYTRYIQVQGDSMTREQIREMAAAGATIGSHSSNHLYPRSWKRLGQDTPAYAAQMQTELLDSGTKLRDLFGNCSTYCYPGGYNTPPMVECLQHSDYRAAFTVLEAKITIEENPYLVHRYMVFGTDSKIFRRAVNFDGEPGIKPTEAGIAAAEAGARAFFPQAFEGLPAPQQAAPQPPAPQPATAQP